MPDQGTDKSKRGATAGKAGDTVQGGAQQFQAGISNMAEMIGRAAQQVARRDTENLELMRRLAETMASSFHATTSEVADWSRQAAERHAEAVRRLTQARSLDELVEIQDSYVHDNLESLLDFGAKVSRLSAEKASEASGHIQQKKRRR